MVFQTFYSASGGRALRVVARCFHITSALAGVGVRVWMGLHGVRDPRQAGGYVGVSEGCPEVCAWTFLASISDK